MRDRGFTAIELLIVFAIIFTLVGIGIPAYNSWKNRSKIAKARADIANIEMAAEMYRTDYGEYPGSIADTEAALKDVKINNIDPWNNAYKYNLSSSGQTIKITSNGPNQTAGDGDDISNTQAW